MANFKKFLWTLAVLPFLAGCSDDNLPDKGGDQVGQKDGDGVYMTVQFQPYSGGSRSYTEGPDASNDGVEPGTEAENKIKRVLIVLATYGDNSYVAHDLVNNDGTNLTESTDGTIYQAKAKIDKTAIHDFYELDDVQAWITAHQTTGNPNPPIKVFVYCNPTTKLVNKFNDLRDGKLSGTEADWTNWTIKLSAAPQNNNEEAMDALWNGTNGFMMSNKNMAVRYLPFAEETWNLYTTPNNPFDLSGMNNQNQYNEVNNSNGPDGAGGSILVHRMAARLDFRDGSQPLAGQDEPLGNGIKGTPFTYATMVDSEGGVLVQSTIYNMYLVNMLNEEYLLERVATGTSANSWTNPWTEAFTSGYQLLGSELPWFNTPTGGGDLNGNYVVTPQAGRRGQALTSNFSNYYLYPFFVNWTNESGELTGQVASYGTGWDRVLVSDVTGNKDGKYPSDANYQGNYNRWRYVTENTFTGGPQNQVNSSSTGVVFSTRINAGAKLKERAEIEGSNYYDKLLVDALDDKANAGPILYYISNGLYCSFEELQYSALMEAGFTPGEEGQLGPDGEPLKITADGVFYNQPLDKSSSLYKIVFGDLGVGEITFHMADGSEVTYADYELNEDGSIKMENGKPVLAAQSQTGPNYLHESIPHNGSTPITTSAQWRAFRDAIVKGGSVTLYEKFNLEGYGWAYWCYYYYWNRHNDNGQPGVMAPMEFATVRNNVYKLAVINLKRLGHPRIPENDPDDPEPTTKDEESDLYMTVTLQVVPWVVRINNIEF